MIDKYLDLVRELKTQWNVKLIIISILVGELGTIPKDLERRQKKVEIRGRSGTIQGTVLLRPARISRGVLEI